MRPAARPTLARQFSIGKFQSKRYFGLMSREATHAHSGRHAFSSLRGREREGLVVFSRRSMLKAGLAGMAGLTLPDLLRLRAESVATGRSLNRQKSVILLWMSGGPSHIDTLD